MRLIFAIILSIFTLNLNAQEREVSKEKTDISLGDSTVLGVVEGLTEYLPVSSTGHLILANSALGLDSDTKVAELKGEPYTIKMAADSYAVIIQIGAIFAVVFVYWRDLLSMALGFLAKDKKGLLLARNLIIAFLPAVLIGLVCYDFIRSFLFGIYPVIVALFAGGIFMLFVQKKYEAKALQKQDVDLSSLSIKQSFAVGLLQCVAMIPGTSRSMMTITGGYLIGLNPAGAARFSFLLGLITLSAASFFKIIKEGNIIFEVISPTSMLWGIFISFVAALVCVKLFVKVLTRFGLGLFAWYRIIFSLVLLAVFWNA